MPNQMPIIDNVTLFLPNGNNHSNSSVLLSSSLLPNSNTSFAFRGVTTGLPVSASNFKRASLATFPPLRATSICSVNDEGFCTYITPRFHPFYSMNLLYDLHTKKKYPLKVSSCNFQGVFQKQE